MPRLPSHIDAGTWRADRRAHEPWFFAVRLIGAEAKAGFEELVKQPGCGYDGIGRVYVIPEEVLGMSPMGAPFVEEDPK